MSEPIQLSEMTLRDYLAAQALAGICANSRWNATNQLANVARSSYELADKMIEERKNEKC